MHVLNLVSFIKMFKGASLLIRFLKFGFLSENFTVILLRVLRIDVKVSLVDPFVVESVDCTLQVYLG